MYKFLDGVALSSFTLANFQRAKTILGHRYNRILRILSGYTTRELRLDRLETSTEYIQGYIEVTAISWRQECSALSAHGWQVTLFV